MWIQILSAPKQSWGEVPVELVRAAALGNLQLCSDGEVDISREFEKMSVDKQD